ncbi:sugar transporter [Xylaria venustula]|nr:sugar transporter [Xylaria venustula]
MTPKPTNSTPLAGVQVIYGQSGVNGLLRQPFILFLACFSSIGGFLFGYDQGVISGVLVTRDFAKEFPLLANDDTLQGWMVSVLTLGALFGALANGPIADRISRRYSILLANIVFLVGSVIQASAFTIPQIFIGRFIAGLSIGQLSMVVPLYLSELSPPAVRGSLVAFQQVGITLGIVTAFWLDYGTQFIGGTGDNQSPASWRFPLAFQTFPSLILAVGTFFLPFSPRWLMMKDRQDEARASLSRIRRVPESDHRIRLEMLEIQASALFDTETTAAMYPGITSPFGLLWRRYGSLFTIRHLNRRLFIACFIQFIQQFTGINAIIYYAPQIFMKLGLSSTTVSLLATGVVGIINLLSTIPAILFIDRWGRKNVLLAGAVGMGICQLIVATIYAVYQDKWEANPAAGWACAVFIWLYIANFAWSIGCVNWIIPSEIFPPGVRSQAVGVAIGTNWLTNFIVALITPRLLNTITFGTFYLFFGFCVILFIWVFFWVPETKGVPIEEMDRLFGGNTGVGDAQRISEIREQLHLSEAIADVSETDKMQDVSAFHVETS